MHTSRDEATGRVAQNVRAKQERYKSWCINEAKARPRTGDQRVDSAQAKDNSASTTERKGGKRDGSDGMATEGRAKAVHGERCENKEGLKQQVQEQSGGDE